MCEAECFGESDAIPKSMKIDRTNATNMHFDLPHINYELSVEKFKILLSAYMKYVWESIGFTPKILKKIFVLKTCFLPIKIHKA
jgi:hypothetical protein